MIGMDCSLFRKRRAILVW